VGEVRLPDRDDPQLLETQARLTSLGLLAAGVAHELSNPLGYVKSNTDHVLGLLRDLDARVRAGAPADDVARAIDEARAVLAENVDGVARMVAITSELRRMSRAPGDAKPCDVEDVLRRALVLTNNALKYKADVRTDLGHPPEVMVDEGRLAQVFVNLLANAAQAIEGRGEVRVATCADAGFTVVEISDTGSGITPERMARLFEPFFTTKAAGVGTGLGLWIVRRIVAEAGGSVDCRSVPGEGTTVTIRLPSITA